MVSKLAQLELVEAPSATDTQILYAHDPSYLLKVIEGKLSADEQREIGFPWSEKMVERSRRSAGATIAAAKTAMKEGISGNLAGGTHHAYRHLGTASILHNDSSIFTLSIHGENNFPFKKEVSDLDLGLPDGCNDQTYLETVAQSLEQLEERFHPDFVIYLAGADPHEGDRLGRLKISKEGMRHRDEMVFQYVLDHQIPLAFSMAGGYGKEMESTVEIHFQTIQTALQFQQRY